jgi:hypothetical protein
MAGQYGPLSPQQQQMYGDGNVLTAQAQTAGPQGQAGFQDQSIGGAQGNVGAAQPGGQFKNLSSGTHFGTTADPTMGAGSVLTSQAQTIQPDTNGGEQQTAQDSNYLTTEERQSLIERGLTNEQIDRVVEQHRTLASQNNVLDPNADAQTFLNAQRRQAQYGGYTSGVSSDFLSLGLNPDGSDPNLMQDRDIPIQKGPIGGQSGNSQITDDGAGGLAVTPDARHQNIFTAPPGTFPTHILEALNSGQLKYGTRFGPVDLSGKLGPLIERN